MVVQISDPVLPETDSTNLQAPESRSHCRQGNYEDDLKLIPTDDVTCEEKRTRPKTEIVWRNVTTFSLLHIGALYGATLVWQARLLTLIWAVFYFNIAMLGITAGAHRLWAHRSYKAKLPCRILLAVLNCCGFQNDVIEWVRDHRVHHKFSETDADPHNAKRGFFFAHVGWLLVRKHPDVKEKGRQFDLSDLYADPVLRLQRRFYAPLVILFCVLIPTLVPVYFWGETPWNAYFICVALRYCLTMNATWTVNSAAHLWGSRPYDTTINPRQNLPVSLWAIGEGFHNYHHAFPQDYATSEWGHYFNLTTVFIDAMACIGQVYDRKKLPSELVERRKQKTGEK